MTEAFAALIEVIGKVVERHRARRGRTPPSPAAGTATARQGVASRQRLAALRPVSITMQEMLLDPPCCVQLRLHWRLEPVEDGSWCGRRTLSLDGAGHAAPPAVGRSVISGHWPRMLSASRTASASRRNVSGAQFATRVTLILECKRHAAGVSSRQCTPSSGRCHCARQLIEFGQW